MHAAAFPGDLVTGEGRGHALAHEARNQAMLYARPPYNGPVAASGFPDGSMTTIWWPLHNCAPLLPKPLVSVPTVPFALTTVAPV